ncbi:MAG: PIG-L family deacetylase [Bacteroidota bacterium]
MMKVLLYSLLFGSLMVLTLPLEAQRPEKPTSADIHDDIKRLSVLASALYVAAHPDDENTRMIAYLSNRLRARTAYLSLTRGDGGQNLIGSEIRELLGIIRTQELMAARRIDGGMQFFSRANDFGYSKNAEETLEIWNKDKVMADMIWTIRQFQPDIIINRFSHNSGRRTHGHHSASAMLSHEAFDLTGREDIYPEQLEYVSTWQPSRLYFNTSWWFYGSREKFAKADKTNMVSVDVGAYYPLKGKSNTEIAAESRSMHRCQGFGSTGSRGSMIEYLELLKGDRSKDSTDLFEGINTTWTRLEGGAPIGQLIKEADEQFQHDDPAAIIPLLINAYSLMAALPDGYWKRVKMEDTRQVISACMGLYMEIVSTDYSATPGDEIKIKFEAINRSKTDVVLERIRFQPLQQDSSLGQKLAYNESFKMDFSLQLPADAPLTNAYWLNDSWELGMYTVENQLLRGLPETPRYLKVACDLSISGMLFTMPLDVVYKKNDPVMGETYRPFELIPPVFANITEKVHVFANDKAKTIEVLLKAGKADLKGELSVEIPEGWTIKPEKIDFELRQKGEEQRHRFELLPPENQSEGPLRALVQIGDQLYDKELINIEYDHIPTQMVSRNSSAKVVRIDLQKLGKKVAYIMGAGDEIPISLEQIGYDVDVLEAEAVSLERLRNYDALILGVRAFNTVDRLKFLHESMMKYVEEGGTMIVQYNTNRRMVTDQFAPYPIKLSRDRVTVEEAEVRFLAPDHRVLNFPNKITSKDFEGWVQERGLYFPNEWDDQYEAILSSNDPGEDPKNGGLLVAKYGKGHYIYTGYSWFRELPAGVPGAYRLFTNMISIGQQP